MSKYELPLAFILPYMDKIRVKENTYSGMFDAVNQKFTEKLNVDYFKL